MGAAPTWCLTDYLQICAVKRFRTISTTFIIVIAVIFGCNIFYIVNLYDSIRSTVEKDVMSAISDADLDELWTRAVLANGETSARINAGQDAEHNHGEMSAGIDSTGAMIAESSVNGETVYTQSLQPDRNHSFNNLFSQTVSRQLHAIIDQYIPVDLNIMDSVVTNRLNNRFIYPDYVATEILDSLGNVVDSAGTQSGQDCDTFTYCYNPAAGLSYRVHMTPLTRHIFSEMAGVIVTIFLLMVAFSLAFWYLLHTVSKMRTIEEMKDDFVSNMTHELKTPIAIAYSANDALLNYDTANDPQKKTTYLTIANKQLKRLGELVENILAMSMERRKTMKLKSETIRLQPFVAEIAAAQRMRGDKDITITVDIDDRVSLEADRTHLANVLNNLIDNAIKYSGDSVAITIAGDHNCISVADNGIGIPATSIPYLFNKFYRVPHGNLHNVRGYGIGLYYVKSILDKAGWTIEVRSQAGEGSVFTIKYGRNEK